jgi:hypothetical protein
MYPNVPVLPPKNITRLADEWRVDVDLAPGGLATLSAPWLAKPVTVSREHAAERLAAEICGALTPHVLVCPNEIYGMPAERRRRLRGWLFTYPAVWSATGDVREAGEALLCGVVPARLHVELGWSYERARAATAALAGAREALRRSSSGSFYTATAKD